MHSDENLLGFLLLAGLAPTTLLLFPVAPVTLLFRELLRTVEIIGQVKLGRAGRAVARSGSRVVEPKLGTSGMLNTVQTSVMSKANLVQASATHCIFQVELEPRPLLRSTWRLSASR